MVCGNKRMYPDTPRTVVAAEVLLVFNYDWWAKGRRDGFPPLVHTNH